MYALRRSCKPVPLWPHLGSSSILHTLHLIDSHLNSLCPSPRREYHIIQYILKGKQECSCKHALADFWSNSYISHTSQQKVRSFSAVKKLELPLYRPATPSSFTILFKLFHMPSTG